MPPGRMRSLEKLRVSCLLTLSMVLPMLSNLWPILQFQSSQCQLINLTMVRFVSIQERPSRLDWKTTKKCHAIGSTSSKLMSQPPRKAKRQVSASKSSHSLALYFQARNRPWTLCSHLTLINSSCRRSTSSARTTRRSSLSTLKAKVLTSKWTLSQTL